MKTRRMNNWSTGLAVGLLLAVSALGWAGPPWGKGGIPAALKACEKALKASEAELASCLEQQGVIFPGDGWPENGYPSGGAPLAYEDNLDGTFTDLNSGLMWEIKDGWDYVQDYTNPHDVENWYTWSATWGGTEPDGTAFTKFLNELNTEPGFAGYTDWRMPTVKELQSLVDYSVPHAPTVSGVLPGETLNVTYWSATSSAREGEEHRAWTVEFYRGSCGNQVKSSNYHVRAVRGGS